jgi:hypothetical protein
MFLGSKVKLVRGADNLTAIYEPTVLDNAGFLTTTTTTTQPVTGIALFLLISFRG